MPYLGAEEAIDEVLTLLARLENDRQETELALQREKDKVVRLNNKIDAHCTRRMQELPAVVQKGRVFKLTYLQQCEIDLLCQAKKMKMFVSEM